MWLLLLGALVLVLLQLLSVVVMSPELFGMRGVHESEARTEAGLESGGLRGKLVCVGALRPCGPLCLGSRFDVRV